MILVFDGDCGFCTSTARWIEPRLPADARVEPWQSLDLAQIGLSEDDVKSASWWIDADGTLHRGHQSVGRALVSGGGIWGLAGRAIITPPISWLARSVYSLVVRFRYRLPGATDACRVPTD